MFGDLYALFFFRQTKEMECLACKNGIVVQHITWFDAIPFRIVHGCDPAAIVCFGVQTTSVVSVERQLLEQDEILELKQHLAQSPPKMKAQVDNKFHEVQFEVGDLVCLRLRPYRLYSIALMANEKLYLRYFFPYCITEKIKLVA